MEFKELREYYNRCNAEEPLAPSDPRNLNIDRYGTERVRGKDWVDSLARQVELSYTPVFILFTGLRGSGKSTELLRLAERLRSEKGAHLLPVYVDAEEALDVTSPVDVADIIASTVNAAEREMLNAEGRNPDDALTDGYLSRLWTWLRNTDIGLKGAEFEIPSGPKLVFEMKTRPTLRDRVRSIITSHLTHFLDEARKELVLINDRAIRRGYRGLIVIFDSLEKLRGTSTNWTEVLNSAERTFAGGAPHLQLPVHAIYTVPPALRARVVEHVEFMPMIKLTDRDGNPFDEGIALARQLIRNRIPDVAIQELFGASSEERVKELILWSGGYPREIVRLLRQFLAIPELPLSEANFRRIWYEICDEYRMAVPGDAFAWLARVAEDRYMTIDSDAQRPLADLMLNNNAILLYKNDKEWYDLHPAVHLIPGVQAARRAPAAPSSTPSTQEG